MPSVTFKISENILRAQPMDPLDVETSVGSLLHYPIEAMALSDPHLVVCNDAHPFAQAAHDAFYGHHPLIITPDDIWFCIAQGFANHVSLHAEELRHRFVSHQGKKKIVISRPDFFLGQPNPWPEAFSEFSEQIAAEVGQEFHDLIIADFSTTTHFHRAATEVLMMDTFQPYFEYLMMCGCGIPEITLTGAPDDWRDIRRRASLLAQFGLEEWINALLPVLDRIEAASRGHVDRDFWFSFFRYQSGSGGSALTGWITVLFPFLKGYGEEKGQLIPNPYIKTWQTDFAHAIDSRGKGRWINSEEIEGPDLGQLPTGLASAPVRFVDVRTGEKHDLRFVAGMFGISQNAKTHSLSTSYGWAIVYDKPVPIAVKKDRRTHTNYDPTKNP